MNDCWKGERRHAPRLNEHQRVHYKQITRYGINVSGYLFANAGCQRCSEI